MNKEYVCDNCKKSQYTTYLANDKKCYCMECSWFWPFDNVNGVLINPSTLDYTAPALRELTTYLWSKYE